MADFIEVAKISELPVGRVRVCSVGERRIALCHTTNGFFAMDNTCPHRGGPLGEGDIIGNELVCPWHLWSFDVATGMCGGNPTLVVNTHEVKVEGDRVLVRIA